MTFVSAADKGHFWPLLGLLWALHRTEASAFAPARVIVFNLGLSKCQQDHLRAVLASPGLAGLEVELRQFAFSHMPRHFDISVEAGCYAWKPVMIADVVDEVGGLVIWLDAGDEPQRRLSTLVRSALLPPADTVPADGLALWPSGFMSSHTSGSFEQWTHPGTIDFIAKRWPSTISSATASPPGEKADPRRGSKILNCNGAFSAFRHNSSTAQQLLQRWRQCAMDKACIAPLGSSRANHRQDQYAPCPPHHDGPKL